MLAGFGFSAVSLGRTQQVGRMCQADFPNAQRSSRLKPVSVIRWHLLCRRRTRLASMSAPGKSTTNN